MYRVPDTLTVEADGAVRIVTINRPQDLNSLDDATHDGLGELWSQIAVDDSARAVVLTGAGTAFCAGGDVKGFDRLTDLRLRRRILWGARRLVHEMVEFQLPIVAAVNGPAIGLGCSIAHLCDIVFIADTAYLADPHAALGLVAGDGGAITWPLLTSLLRAKEYLYTGDRIPATKAVELGLANRVVPADQLMTESLAMAQRLAALPWQSIQDTKRAINIHLRQAVSSVMNFAFMAESESFSTDELQANVASFKAR
jgi:enoyl-CoA hydratase